MIDPYGVEVEEGPADAYAVLSDLVLAWAFNPSVQASRDLMAWACDAKVGYVSPAWRKVEGGE